MVRSPKTGRELRGERADKAPGWLRTVIEKTADLLGSTYHVREPNYTEELRFHDENGVERYWEENEGEDGLDFVLEALDSLEAEKDSYSTAQNPLASQQLEWTRRVEVHAYDLIRSYFQDEYGTIPETADDYGLSSTEETALERHETFETDFFTERL